MAASSRTGAQTLKRHYIGAALSHKTSPHIIDQCVHINQCILRPKERVRIITPVYLDWVKCVVHSHD
jgi:hypothetical protein